MILVVFDCDGTLVDSQYVITAAMAGAFARHGRPHPRREDVRRVVGLSLDVAVERLLPDAMPSEVASLAEAYKAEFQTLRQRADHHEPLFPGIRATLEELSRAPDVVLGVATGKSVRGVHSLLVRERLDGVFATIQTADTNPSKPHPAMLEAAMRDTGAAAGRTLMIGDTTFDMEMAISAGARALGVGWGYHDVEELEDAGAHRIVTESPRLLEAVRAEFDLLMAA
ncbi:MAG: HAD-IA family hydrolase [Hyphomicrobium sp.]|nr:HAD-IA family hydrolase [Hyphomicrobium sp.]